MKLKTKRVQKPRIYLGRKNEKRPMLERLDDYIEFAHNTKKFSDAGFYEEVKEYISELKEDIGELEELLESQQEHIEFLSESLSDFEE